MVIPSGVSSVACQRPGLKSLADLVLTVRRLYRQLSQ